MHSRHSETHRCDPSPPPLSQTSSAKPNPSGLVEVLTTGGVPPVISEPCSAERVYKALFKRVLLQNERYYARFPDDVGVVGRIVTFLASQPEGCVVLPSGTRLTPRTLQLLGLSGLGSGGACTARGTSGRFWTRVWMRVGGLAPCVMVCATLAAGRCAAKTSPRGR